MHPAANQPGRTRALRIARLARFVKGPPAARTSTRLSARSPPALQKPWSGPLSTTVITILLDADSTE